ncbi:protein-tyrosine phosphatase family protein [Acidimangrovimonas sediminis]|uniref:protein-tyrosine phosphatase family protein n=1 Tax=Acidimangrovimonas sediminis TaxID=2056283 RepID=UPI001E431740|nr:protein-tyrosine phosphatase family protein [Acidimangrovimonas sediminis]
MEYEIAEIGMLSGPRPGAIGIAPAPGLAGDYKGDLAALLSWTPGLVLSLVSEAEAEAVGARRLAADLGRRGIAWMRFAIADFSAPDAMKQEAWPPLSAELRAAIGRGGRLLVHCRAGCGRSGMVVLRLMVDAGEAPGPALARLRAARPCAVETAAQMAWAVEG